MAEYTAWWLLELAFVCFLFVHAFRVCVCLFSAIETNAHIGSTSGIHNLLYCKLKHAFYVM